MSGGPALQLWGVGKDYGVFRKRAALTSVSIRVNRGESYGLAGPNGAGKTTLIRILLGMSAPDQGEVRLFGGRPDDPEARRRVGFVPEAAELPPAASPRQLVKRFARLKGLAAEAERDGLLQLDRLGMAAFLDRPAQRFSKGEKQRTLLALALMGGPELLVLDEPTDGLDPLGRALVRRVLREENEKGRTIFLNSHLLSETERICSRVGILHGGRLVREETVGERSEAEQGESAVVLARALPEDVLGRLGLRAAPSLQGQVTESGGVTILVAHGDVEQLNAALDALRAAGGLIVEVRRIRADLEASFEAAVAPGALVQRRDEDPPPAAPSAVRGRSLRGVRGALAVSREIASDLAARRTGWVALAFALVVVGFFFWGVHHDLVQGAAALVRTFDGPRGGGAGDAGAIGRMVGRTVATVAYWALVSYGVIFSAFFAPPILEPRRAILLLAQPIGRGDLALGIWLAVCGLAFAGQIFLVVILFAGLRFLGIEVPFKFLLLPAATLIAFASLYSLVLGATYVWRSAIFGVAVALLSLFGVAVVGADHGPAASRAWDVASAFLPKVIGIGRQAMRIGAGESVSAPVFLLTAVWVLALLIVIRIGAGRSER